ncbi:MAG: PASTA domain-containing protein [Deinococcales bacterium]
MTKKAAWSVDLLLLLFSLLVLLAALVWVSLSTLRDYLNIGEVEVPNLQGANIEQAERVLKSLGLEVNIYPKSSNQQEFNTIVAQNPSANTTVRRGREVSLGVNLPKQSINVPQMMGMLQEDALRLLARSNLQLGDVNYTYSDAASGTILSSNPAAQSLVEEGTTVHFVISRGPAASEISMPQLVGLNLEEAKKRLKAQGINRVESVVSSAGGQRAGQVVAQDPIAGRQIIASAPVMLYYAMNDPNVIPVPDVEGLSFEEAYNRLSAAGFSLKTAQWLQVVNDPSKPQGIIFQQPKGFSLVGTPVHLIINSFNNSNVLSPPSDPNTLNANNTSGFQLTPLGAFSRS